MRKKEPSGNFAHMKLQHQARQTGEDGVHDSISLPLIPARTFAPYLVKRNVTTPAESSTTETKSSTTKKSTTLAPSTSFPSLSLLPAVKTTISSTTVNYPTITASAHTGTAPLLTGSCSSAQFTLVDMTTAVLWLPVVGCAGDRLQCCALNSPSGASSTLITSSLITGDFMNGGSGLATLSACPQDYHTVSTSLCCPISYNLYASKIGSSIPCFSTSTFSNLPPVPVAVTDRPTPTSAPGPVTVTVTESSKPTLAVINIVFAAPYPVRSTDNSLSTGAKAGIGVGGGIGGMALLVGLGFIIWKLLQRNKKRRKTKIRIPSQTQPQMYFDDPTKPPNANPFAPNDGRPNPEDEYAQRPPRWQTIIRHPLPGEQPQIQELDPQHAAQTFELQAQERVEDPRYKWPQQNYNSRPELGQARF